MNKPKRTAGQSKKMYAKELAAWKASHTPAAHFEMPEPGHDSEGFNLCGMVEASLCPDCGEAGTCEECVADAGIDAVADATSSHCGPTGGR